MAARKSKKSIYDKIMGLFEVKKRKKRPRKKSTKGNSVLMKRILWTVRVAWVVWLLGFVVALSFFVMVRIDFMGLFGAMPRLDSLDNPNEELSSRIYSADGQLLGKYYVTSSNRTAVDFEDIPDTMVNTALSAEDIRFFEHSGVDLKSVFRAVFGKLTGRAYGGGSTITQQTIKNLFNTREERYQGSIQNRKISVLFAKAKEWILSIYLERKYTKKEILAMYLNTVTLGNNSNGIKVGAKTYFNTEVESITYPQAAIIMGLVNAPSRYNPVKHPERALRKRNIILNQLYKYDFISKQETVAFQKSDLGLKFRASHQSEGPTSYFRAVAKNWLGKWTKANGYDLYQGGLKIYTTLDSRVQAIAEKAVHDHMQKLQQVFDKRWEGRNPWIDDEFREVKGYLDREFRKTEHYRIFKKRYKKHRDSIRIMAHKKYKLKVYTMKGEVDTLMSPIDSLNHYKRFLNTGFMAMEPKTGHVKAWVGGINHKYFKFDHVKQGKRQPGSTFKAFTYTVAIEAGYSPCFEVDNVPVTFQVPGQIPPVYVPKNSDDKYEGERMTLREALARSINQITAYVMKQVGPENVVKKAHLMGIKSELDPVPALCLGVSPVSVYEMVGAYCVFANKGIRNDPIWIDRIEDKDGNVIYSPSLTNIQAMSEQNAYVMLYMLRGTAELSGGTALGLGSELRNGNEIGGKTGTTQNGSDGWFMGITQDLVAGAWVGGDTKHIRFRNWYEGQGARTALPIVRKFFQLIYQDSTLSYKKKKFEIPSKPLQFELDCDKYDESSPTDDEDDDSEPADRRFGL